MHLLDLTLPTPAENLALDEALLAAAEAAGGPRDVLRLWESPQPAIVVGRSSKIAVEVDESECHRRGIPVLRRPSGGAAVMIGPGCLMYSVVLSYVVRPQLRQIDAAHRFVLGSLSRSLERHVAEVAHRGTSDLVISNDPPTKFSGNSLRCKRSHLLYHGTILFDFPLDLISECLKAPPRQPEYRADRDHGSFVSNLPLGRNILRHAVANAFDATDVLTKWPRQLVADLVAERYSQPKWNRDGVRGERG
jgi:lipoate-protein ligase A